jgi:hypothetical protein
MTEYNVDDLVDVPVGGLTDEDKDRFDGVKSKVAKVLVQEKEVPFQNGQMLPDGQTVKVTVAVVESEPIGTDALGNPIVVKEEFNLKQHPVTKKWGASRHEKSKANKFFAKLKVNSFKECIGKDILVVKKVSSKNPDRSWLGINI